jgi:hypothetical protein
MDFVRRFFLKSTACLLVEAGGFSFGGTMNGMTILFALGWVATVLDAQSQLPPGQETTAQVMREGSFALDTSADRALEFFTPEGERAWVHGWEPKPLYPPQAAVAFQSDSVFRLDHGEEHSLWTIVEADLRRHVAEYVYVVEGERVSRVRVEVQPLGEQHCRVHVRYVHTATSEKGMQFLAGVTEEAYAQKMQDWRRMVSAAIR